MSKPSNGSDGGDDRIEDLVREAERRARAERGHDAVAAPWAPIDLVLEQGDDEELAAARGDVGRDPLRALELAETIHLVEQLRDVRVEPSAVFAGKMQSVAAQADRFQRHHFAAGGPRWRLHTAFAAAAAATFWALSALDVAVAEPRSASDPLGFARVDSAASEPRAAVRVASVTPEPVLETDDVAWQENVRRIQRRLDVDGGDHLRDAFSAGLEVAGGDLSEWLDPANAVTMMRLGHELRASSANRAAALRGDGTLPAVDRRVQAIAAGLAQSLLEREQNPGTPLRGAELDEVSWTVRALIGAGPVDGRRQALHRGGELLAAALDGAYGEDLVTALAGLVEVTAVSGEHLGRLVEHGRRLVSDVLDAQGDTWQRRRPALLAGAIAPGVLGDAGRLCAQLPAFGIDAYRCTLVRRLVLGRLREQRATGQDRPEVLAAMVYGCADLLDDGGRERDRLAWALRRWKPAHLAPDYATVKQMAWSFAPGSRGHTRMQRELRQLSVLDAPHGVRDRAAFCLCLATNFASARHMLGDAPRGQRGS